MWCKMVRSEGEMAVLWGVKARGTAMVGMVVGGGVGVGELSGGPFGLYCDSCWGSARSYREECNNNLSENIHISTTSLFFRYLPKANFLGSGILIACPYRREPHSPTKYVPCSGKNSYTFQK